MNIAMTNKCKSNLLISQLGVPSVLLSINGLVVWPTNSLHEAEAGISPHRSVHLITWEMEIKTKAVNLQVYGRECKFHILEKSD